MLSNTPHYITHSKITKKIKVLRSIILCLPNALNTVNTAQKKKPKHTYVAEGLQNRFNALTPKELYTCIVPSVALSSDGLLYCAPETSYERYKVITRHSRNREKPYCMHVVEYPDALSEKAN